MGNETSRLDPLESAERLRKLADVMEANPEHVDMKQWIILPGRLYGSTVAEVIGHDMTECGTTACAAGWAVWLWPGAIPADSVDGPISDAAQQLLGLTDDEAAVLFYGVNDTAEIVAGDLRDLATKREQQ